MRHTPIDGRNNVRLLRSRCLSRQSAPPVPHRYPPARPPQDVSTTPRSLCRARYIPTAPSGTDAVRAGSPLPLPNTNPLNSPPLTSALFGERAPTVVGSS
jgi:hypothetical protein